MEKQKVINQLQLAIQEAVADLPIIDDIPEKNCKKISEIHKQKTIEKKHPCQNEYSLTTVLYNNNGRFHSYR